MGHVIDVLILTSVLLPYSVIQYLLAGGASPNSRQAAETKCHGIGTACQGE
jgi:hypothetical protein